MLKTRLSRFNETSIFDYSNQRNTYYHVVKQRFHYFDIDSNSFNHETSSLTDDFCPGENILYLQNWLNMAYK